MRHESGRLQRLIFVSESNRLRISKRTGNHGKSACPTSGSDVNVLSRIAPRARAD